MKSEKKEAEKGRKKATVNAPVFSSLIGSHYIFHAVWVLLWFLKGHIAPQVFKKDSGELFWIIGHSVTFICQTSKKRAKKGRQKGYSE
jgi:tryptophan-rich sensory protein